MSRLTTMLVLSFIVLLTAGTVVYAQATEAPVGNGTAPATGNTTTGDASDWHDQMHEVCVNGSELTPEQREEHLQNMEQHMEDGTWQQHMGDGTWEEHHGEGGPMGAGNWEEMRQKMDEHMGDGTWEEHHGNAGSNGSSGMGMQS